VFGEIAATYDRLRPAYPAAMFDDLIEATRLAPGATVLEIGPGTGIATRPILEKGLRVTAVEPDGRMVEFARAQRGMEGVEFVTNRFEEYPAAPASFDLVLAAGSWHWIEPEAGLMRAASALRSGGGLAVAWNLPRPESSRRPQGLDDVYQRVAAELAEASSQVRNRDPDARRRVIAGSGLFSEPESFRYPWARPFTSADYCHLLSTHSDHRMLGPERLERLLTGVGEVVDAHGGNIELAYETVMYVAMKV
jgi:SAM-dependent methyltransferase